MQFYFKLITPKIITKILLMKNSIKLNAFALAILLLMQSCVSKREILYLQDIDSNPAMEVVSNTDYLAAQRYFKNRRRGLDARGGLAL